MSLLLLHLICVLLGSSSADSKFEDQYISGNDTDRVTAYKFLHENDKAATDMCTKVSVAQWNYASNLTEENKQVMLDMQAVAADFQKETWKNATKFAWKSFRDETEIYRWFKSLSILGLAALPDGKLNQLNKLVADMEDIYSKGKVCQQKSPKGAPCEWSLEPELSEMMSKSRDYKLLKYIWKSWRDVSGKKIKNKFLQYVSLSNEGAKLNGFPDAGALWREAYESSTFEEDLEELWKALRPFYEQLHAYVRRKLMHLYTSCNVRPDGPIPAHILGNMWAQTWENIMDVADPFPDKSEIDVTTKMKEKNMTILEMFQVSEEFFTSLGLKPMTPEFWNKSIIEKPDDREIVCHASAWDFCDGKDQRIKMCTKVNMEDLITVHHEMGHIEYYLQYAQQPNVFREGANPGFHEAVGDVLALSVATPDHLKKIGLLDEVSDDKDGEIKFLMRMALEKIAFLPFGYLIDQWRWKVFSGEFKPEEMNHKWWELRLKYQGVCPPVERTEDDLDAAAKYHVTASVPYIRYFVSTIIQFQFHKALCDAAEYKGPLHKCDIYQNKKAGEVLSTVLSLGSSVPWTEAMGIMTGGVTEKMDASAILEYFDPLIKWLQEKNQNEFIGWKSDDPMICP